MNKKIMTWSEYETPSVKMLDVLSEGVLCTSGALTISEWEWESDDESLNF